MQKLDGSNEASLILTPPGGFGKFSKNSPRAILHVHMRKVEVTYKLRSCYYLSIAMANMGHASIGAIRPKKFAKPLPQKSRRILFLTGANGLGYEVKGTKPNRRANITTMLARDWHPKYKQVVYRNENLRQ